MFCNFALRIFGHRDTPANEVLIYAAKIALGAAKSCQINIKKASNPLPVSCSGFERLVAIPM
jgi:hypothetical protein